MQTKNTTLYYNEIPFLITTTYDIYDGMKIEPEEVNNLFNLLENGFISNDILSVSETLRAIIFFIEDLEYEDITDTQQNWFYNIEKSNIEKVIAAIEKYWKRSDWGFLDPSAIFIYYFGDFGAAIDEECYNDDYWVIDNANYQAKSKCGKYKINFNQEDWTNFKESEFECIENYIPIPSYLVDGNGSGIFYDENKIINKTNEMLKIINDINLCLMESNEKIITIKTL